MTDKLRRIANSDTPATVEVNSLTGLAVWAAGRFGVSIIFAAVFGYATREVYRDGTQRQDQLMQYVVERNVTDAKRAVSDAALALSLDKLSESIAKMCDEARASHIPNKPAIARP